MEDPMCQVEPRIIERFPEYRERILQERSRGVIVDELCRDYDAILEALEAENAGEIIAHRRARTHQQLLQLARALEQEMLTRLAGCSTAKSANKPRRSPSNVPTRTRVTFHNQTGDRSRSVGGATREISA